MHLFNCSTELFFEYDKILSEQWMVTRTNMKHEFKWYAHQSFHCCSESSLIFLGTGESGLSHSPLLPSDCPLFQF